MSRFGDLAKAQVRRFTGRKDDNAQEEVPESYPYSRLALWATRDVYQEEMVPLLNALIGDNDNARRNAISSHPHMTYFEGRADSLVELLARFDKWRKDQE